MPKDNFLRVASPEIGSLERSYILQALDAGEISSQGKFVGEFEERFASDVGVKYALTTSNGTTALHLALLAAGVKSGDEVIVPSVTFVATANAVTYIGAKPVFADINEKYWCIEPLKMQGLITDKTTAIIPVHLYGHPADMEAVLNLANANNLMVIEDAAEAHGAKFKEQKVGSIGDAGIYSFYGNKILSTGEGGMVTTNSQEIFEKAKLLRDHGSDPVKRFWHPVIGYNYRMTNLQAAVGLGQLEKQKQFLDVRSEIADSYTKYLSGTSDFTFQSREDWASPVCWLFSMLIRSDVPNIRDDLMSYLLAKNIETRPFFYPMHTLPPYQREGTKGNVGLGVSEYVAARGVNLPTSVTMDLEDVRFVSEEVMKFFGR